MHLGLGRAVTMGESVGMDGWVCHVPSCCRRSSTRRAHHMYARIRSHGCKTHLFSCLSASHRNGRLSCNACCNPSARRNERFLLSSGVHSIHARLLSSSSIVQHRGYWGASSSRRGVGGGQRDERCCHGQHGLESTCRPHGISAVVALTPVVSKAACGAQGGGCRGLAARAYNVFLPVPPDNLVFCPPRPRASFVGAARPHKSCELDR